MRYFLILIMSAFLLPAVGVAQQGNVLDSADQLVRQKQYESAFKLLKEADPQNNDEDILVKKTKIAINYFVTSIEHVMFAFKDLSADEHIMDYRGKGGSYSMHIFDVDSLSRRLLDVKGPSAALYQNLTTYWFDVYLRYGNQQSPLDSVRKYAKKSIAYGGHDADTYYKLGYSYLLDDRIGKSIEYFNKSIQRNDSFPTSHYNLAYAYLMAGEPSNSLVHANRALALYEDSIQKGDAALMAAVALIDLNRPQKALDFLDQSDHLSPGNINALQTRLQAYFMLDKKEEADRLAKNIVAKDPGNPGMIQNISELYVEAGAEDRFVLLINQLLPDYAGKNEILGNLYFAIARVTMQDDPETAEQSLLKAEENFSKSYPEQHSIFNVIQQALQYVREQKGE
ncbi:MAG: hypothetical protein R6T91_07605 [Bacteroidales bacterium]